MKGQKEQPKDIKAKHQEKVDDLRRIKTLIEYHPFKGQLKSTIRCEDKQKRVTDGAAIVHKEINNTLSKRTQEASLGMFAPKSVSDSNISEELLNKTFTSIISTLASRTDHTFFGLFKEREKSTADLYLNIIEIAEKNLGMKKSMDGYEEAEYGPGLTPGLIQGSDDP